MKEESLIELGMRLKALRRALKISQKDFAAQIDVSGSYLSEIESGKTRPGYNFIMLISAEFRINPSWLLLEQGDMFLGDPPQSPDSAANASTGSGDETAGETGENAVVVDKKTFGDQTDRVIDLLWHLEHSPLVLSTVLGFAAKFLYDNEGIIRKDIERNRPKKEEPEKDETKK